jgi:glucoamylase
MNKRTLYFTLLFISCIFSNCVRFLDSCSGASARVDCGFMGINQQQCESRGCCWVPVNPNPGNLPWCFNKQVDPQPYVPPAGGVPFNETEVSIMMGYFLRNIDVSSMVSDPCQVNFGGPGFGGVVAAPDCNTGPGGSYVYAWMRDSALTMKTLMDVHPDPSFVKEKIEKYVNWVLENHKASSPNGIDVRIEPKMMLPRPGTVFPGAWCRPQNDGPGLQAITLISYANTLLDRGQNDYVRQYIWTGSNNFNGGAVKHDLDWVADNWNSNTCDLWEEITSSDFFWNKYTMRKALYMGADLARRLGDSYSADRFARAANDISNQISSHWNGQFIYESQNRQKDTAVIIALNEAYMNDTLFAPSSFYVASTIKTFNDLFQGAYYINQIDSRLGVPGVLYGRYEGDRYDGGGPWILNSAALAQLYYNAAIDVLTRLRNLPEDSAMNVWANLIGKRPSSIQEFANSLLSLGDGVLLRIRYHVENSGFHLSEQLDRNSGFQLSAKDLTWSYAETLKAVKKRNILVALLK